MNAAIILSGGVGTRLGTDIPKQYIQVGGKSILSYCVETFIKSDSIELIVIVCADEWKNCIKESITGSQTILFAEPGETRQLSILNALTIIKRYIPDAIEKVIIQDGARPMCSEKLISDCLEACVPPFSGVMPVLPMKDTIYISKDGNSIDNLIDRETLFAGQAPEAFLFNEYYNSHLNLSHNDLLKINGSSELAFRSGMQIKLIPGDPMNFKITDMSDLERFKSIVKSK